MTPEQIENAALDRYPIPSRKIRNSHDVTVNAVAYEKQKAFIEGAKMVVSSKWTSVADELPVEFESLNGVEMPSECRVACHLSGGKFESDETGDVVSITHWQYATTPNI